ncbi:MAG: T9SS type A sorting domain-containing protein [bacterium]|nr:T9SS type A sorting domain-containing protein [bacterium]
MIKHLLHLLIVIALIPTLSLAADVEYSTTGVMDTPATLGGDRDGWGTDFVTRWDNTTGHDVVIDEFGWPCGGWWAQFWMVWIRDTLPENPWTLEHYGTFVAASEDDTEWPPSLYTYIDMSEEQIVIPAGASMYFGYGNPGMGGQIGFNGVETWSWLNDAWDMDGGFGRTAVMQFKGTFATTSVDETPAPITALSNYPNPFNPATTIAFSLPRDMTVDLAVYSLRGRLVRRLLQGAVSAGTRQATWNGTDGQGHAMPSGIYMVRLMTEDGVDVRKIVLAK